MALSGAQVTQHGLAGFSQVLYGDFTAKSNSTPTDIALSRTTVSVTGGLNATVGTLSATDSDVGETYAYTLVAGTGDTDNASFDITGATLSCNDPAALGVSARSVRIRVTDSANNTLEEAFTISVIDATFALLSSASSVVTSIVTSRI